MGAVVSAKRSRRPTAAGDYLYVQHAARRTLSVGQLSRKNCDSISRAGGVWKTIGGEGGVESRPRPDLRRRTWDFVQSWFNKADNHPLHTIMKDLETIEPFVWGELFEYEEAIKYDGEELSES
jgi:hypothetical protein